MLTPDTDNNGQLPPHLLCTSNPINPWLDKVIGRSRRQSSRSANTSGVLHLHIAHQYHNVCSCFGLDTTTLDNVDRDGYACHGAKYDNDRDGNEYTENVFRLLKAYPETVITAMMMMNEKAKVLGGCFAQILGADSLANKFIRLCCLQYELLSLPLALPILLSSTFASDSLSLQ